MVIKEYPTAETSSAFTRFYNAIGPRILAYREATLDLDLIALPSHIMDKPFERALEMIRLGDGIIKALNAAGRLFCAGAIAARHNMKIRYDRVLTDASQLELALSTAKVSLTQDEILILRSVMTLASAADKKLSVNWGLANVSDVEGLRQAFAGTLPPTNTRPTSAAQEAEFVGKLAGLYCAGIVMTRLPLLNDVFETSANDKERGAAVLRIMALLGTLYSAPHIVEQIATYAYARQYLKSPELESAMNRSVNKVNYTNPDRDAKVKSLDLFGAVEFATLDATGSGSIRTVTAPIHVVTEGFAAELFSLYGLTNGPGAPADGLTSHGFGYRTAATATGASLNILEEPRLRDFQRGQHAVKAAVQLELSKAGNDLLTTLDALAEAAYSKIELHGIWLQTVAVMQEYNASDVATLSTVFRLPEFAAYPGMSDTEAATPSVSTGVSVSADLSVLQLAMNPVLPASYSLLPLEGCATTAPIPVRHADTYLRARAMREASDGLVPMAMAPASPRVNVILESSPNFRDIVSRQSGLSYSLVAAPWLATIDHAVEFHPTKDELASWARLSVTNQENTVLVSSPTLSDMLTNLSSTAHTVRRWATIFSMTSIGIVANLTNIPESEWVLFRERLIKGEFDAKRGLWPISLVYTMSPVVYGMSLETAIKTCLAPSTESEIEFRPIRLTSDEAYTLVLFPWHFVPAFAPPMLGATYTRQRAHQTTLRSALYTPTGTLPDTTNYPLVPINKWFNVPNVVAMHMMRSVGVGESADGSLAIAYNQTIQPTPFGVPICSLAADARFHADVTANEGGRLDPTAEASRAAGYKPVTLGLNAYPLEKLGTLRQTDEARPAVDSILAAILTEIRTL